MMNRTSLVLWGCLLGSLLLTSCKVFKVPDYKEFKHFKIEKWGLTESTVAVDLVYHNPNAYGFKIKQSSSDVYIENVYLGKAVTDSTIIVAKKSDFVIPIRVQADMKNLLKNAWMTLTRKSVLLKVNGTITAGMGRIYRSFPYSYEGRHEVTLWGSGTGKK
jgi:LEA14-like dessication related protein